MTRFRLAAVLGFASSLILLPVMGSVTAASASTGAAASTGTVTYRGTPGSAARGTHAAGVSALPKVASAFRNEGPLMFTPRRPGGASSAASRKASAAAAVTGGRVHPYPTDLESALGRPGGGASTWACRRAGRPGGCTPGALTPGPDPGTPGRPPRP